MRRVLAMAGVGMAFGTQLLCASACSSAVKPSITALTTPAQTSDDNLKLRELVAQEDMARSARRQLVLSWFTLIGLAGTVIYTRKQILDNRKQMAAFIVEVGSTFHVEGGYATKMIIGLMNSGGTHALDFHAWGNIGVYAATEELPRAPKRKPEVTSMPLGPGQSRVVPLVGPEFLSTEEVQRINSGQDVLAAQVVGSYVDVFGRKQAVSINLKTEVITTGLPRLVFY